MVWIRETQPSLSPAPSDPVDWRTGFWFWPGGGLPPQPGGAERGHNGKAGGAGRGGARCPSCR